MSAVSTLPPLRAACFDMDGTLVDTERLWAEALADLLTARGASGATPDDCLALLYGRAWSDACRALAARWPGYVDSPEAMALPLRERFDARFDRTPPVIPGSVALLRDLAARGAAIAVVSGSPRADIEHILTVIGVRRLVAVIVGSEDCSRGKPDPEGYLRALSALGVAASEAIALEDSEVGVAAAKAAGLYTVGLGRPGAYPQVLDSADRLVGDLAELI